MFASFVAFALTALAQPIPDGRSALARACEGRDGWSDPAPPARIFGNTYYVGTCGISAILITGPRGHILIDGATERAAALIAANIERLGFRMRDVKLILSSHEHVDHAGGIAELQRLSGATVAARRQAIPALGSGRPQLGDPQFGALAPFPAIRVGRMLRDGEVVRLGTLSLTMHATQGHSPGSTSWTWRSCEGRRCLNIAYADSITAIGGDSFRFSTNPSYVAAFRRSIARIAALPCDLLLTPHPGASNFFQRLASGRLTDRAACRDYAARGTARLDQTLREERAR